MKFFGFGVRLKRLRREACMRKIFLSFILIAAGNFALPAAFGQGSSGQDMMAKASRQDLDRLKPKLEEYRQGKRDVHDGYVIMFRMLQDYARLKEGDSPEAKALFEEFNQLKKQHPEAQKSVSWVVHSGSITIIKNDFYTKGEKAAREAEEKKRQNLADQRKNFVPTDNYIMGVEQQGDKAMVWHQYRIEFYRVPKGTTLKNDNEKLFLRQGNQDLPLSNVQLIKTMSFVYPFYFDGPIDSFVSANSKRDFWFCSDPIIGYTAHTSEEYAILGEGAGDRTVGHIPYWKNPKGTIESFCGILDVQGNIVYQLPTKYQPHLPGPLIRPGPGLPNGKKTSFYVGSAVEDTVDGGLTYGSERQLLIWEAPDKLTIITLPPPAPGHAGQLEHKILKQYGLIK